MRTPNSVFFPFSVFATLVSGCGNSTGAGVGGTTSASIASSSTGPSLCGNGVVDPGEECDDGNNFYADGCSGECKVEPGWTCSDAPSKCIPGPCGDGHPVGDKDCDDGNLVDGDGCSSKCKVEPGYHCTGRPSVCTVINTCGDGVLFGAEECDDGNLTNGDCCDSTCHIESGCEREPNDTIATANVLAQVALAGGVHGFISSGDVDYFSFTVPLGPNADISAETRQGILGTMCSTGGPGIDSRVRIFDVTGALVVSDYDGGAGLCSRAVAVNVPPGTYYAAVDASPFAGPNTTWDYELRVSVAPTHCGNGVVDPGEQCDDGNTKSGDGCSSSCQFECAGVAEIEPNDSPAAASGPIVPGVGVCGAIYPVGDADVWRFSLASYSDISLETFDASGASCVGIDTVATLFAPDGTTPLAVDDDSGVGLCAFIKSATHEGARHLAPGTYYVEIQDFAASADTAYKLFLTLDAVCGNGIVEGSEQCDGGPSCDATCRRIPKCGDGFVDPPEQCDDGNTVSGDGCSSTCTLEKESNCNNGIDDDGNGMVDCADPACAFACAKLTCDPGDTLLAIPAINLPQPILDLQTTMSNLEVVSPGVVKKIAVRFNAKHSYDADVELRLVPPGAPILDLSTKNGGGGQNYVDTIFVDDPTACVIGSSQCNVAPFTGAFQPQGTMMAPGFTSVIGTPAAGTWKFSVYDDTPGDQGVWQTLDLALCVGP